MNSKTLRWAIRMLYLLTLVSAAAASAQERWPVERFTGLINDYSPSNVKGGPWEMHGQWSLDLQRWWGIADFSADLTMSDYGTPPNPAQPGQGAHTHHIKLTNAAVTWNMDGCPTFSPATQTGFQINGTVSLLTGNGSIAPFETDPPSSTLQICVTGGDEVPYSVSNSNITLVFGGPATTHFGPQAIHGVVHNTR